MAKEMTLGSFLGHSTRTDRAGFLRGWKKREGAAVDTWLHRKAPILALWQHNFPHIYEKKEDDGSVTRHVYGNSVNCLESEEVLTKQYKRDRETDERIVPPVICPICLLQECLVEMFSEGRINFTSPLFEWEGDKASETTMLTFGGMLNRYGSDKLPQELVSEMVKAGVRKSEAWRENTIAKCNYVFVVVDNANPDDGVQVAVETTSLGDHVKSCIADEMKRNAPDTDLGNPLLNPYVIRWEHHEKAKEFSKKYKAIAMTRVKLTPEVDALISGTPPNLDRVTKAPNLKLLRADLEAHYIGKPRIDWDSIFGPAERAGIGVDDEVEQRALAEDEVEVEVETVAKPAAKVAAPAPAAAEPTVSRRRKVEAAPPPPPPEPAEETIPCDQCGADMPTSATKCAACGAEYELEGEAPAAAEPPAVVASVKGTGAKKGLPF